MTDKKPDWMKQQDQETREHPGWPGLQEKGRKVLEKMGQQEQQRPVLSDEELEK